MIHFRIFVLGCPSNIMLFVASGIIFYIQVASVSHQQLDGMEGPEKASHTRKGTMFAGCQIVINKLQGT